MSIMGGRSSLPAPRRTDPLEAVTPMPDAREDHAQRLLKKVRLTMAFVWTLAILFLCWMPGDWVQSVEEESSLFELPDLDKIVHASIFVVFAVLWVRGLRTRRRYAWVALAGIALAAITEVVQELPAIGRDGELGDAITDVIGLAVGLIAARWIEPLLTRLEALVFRTPQTPH